MAVGSTRASSATERVMARVGQAQPRARGRWELALQGLQTTLNSEFTETMTKLGDT